MGILRRGPDRELKRMVKGQDIPEFQAVTLRILEKLRDPEVDFGDVAECIQWDPGLVVQLLRTANSAAYGVHSRIEDVRHAISLLGRSQLEQIVLSIAVRDSLPMPSVPGFQSERFWGAAAFRAAVARALAEKLHPARNAEAFTAGLLQDMAIPVIAHARPDEYAAVLYAWHGGDGNLHELEEQAFGWTHARVGALLGQAWQLPDNLVQATEHHHGEHATDEEVLPATRLVALLGELNSDRDHELLIERARSDYGLEPDWIREVLVECLEKSRELAQGFLS